MKNLLIHSMISMDKSDMEHSQMRINVALFLSSAPSLREKHISRKPKKVKEVCESRLASEAFHREKRSLITELSERKCFWQALLDRLSTRGPA